MMETCRTTLVMFLMELKAGDTIESMIHRAMKITTIPYLLIKAPIAGLVIAF